MFLQIAKYLRKKLDYSQGYRDPLDPLKKHSTKLNHPPPHFEDQ